MKVTPLKIHNVLVELGMMAIVSYFVFRKLTDYSASSVLGEVFHEGPANLIVRSLTALAIYILLARLVIFLWEKFSDEANGGSSDVQAKFPHYDCLYNNNVEIAEHLDALKSGNLDISNLSQAHQYTRNIHIIHQSLARRIMQAANTALTEADVFISFFHDADCRLDIENISDFGYQSHYSATEHITATAVISTNDPKLNTFAGVAAIRNGKPNICVSIEGQYEIGGEERRKTIRHYIGIPLKVGRHVAALLNIEFHNKKVFKSGDELQDFYRREIQGFIYLYEYQVHKNLFFRHLYEKAVKV